MITRLFNTTANLLLRIAEKMSAGRLYDFNKLIMNILETIIPKKFAEKTFANSKFKVDDTTWYRLFFDKEEDQRWYIRIPEWPYSHHNLMMVAGADDLCEFFSHDNKAIVFVSPSKAEHNCYDSLNDGLIYKKETSSLTGGATYKLVNIYNELADKWGIPKTIWLCPVTLFVFGKYPEYLTIRNGFSGRIPPQILDKVNIPQEAFEINPHSLEYGYPFNYIDSYKCSASFTFDTYEEAWREFKNPTHPYWSTVKLAEQYIDPSNE